MAGNNGQVESPLVEVAIVEVVLGLKTVLCVHNNNRDTASPLPSLPSPLSSTPFLLLILPLTLPLPQGSKFRV